MSAKRPTKQQPDASLLSEIDNLLTIIPYCAKDGAVVAPNAALRSALFIGADSTRKKALRKGKIASLAGIEITYTGIRLDQGDLDCWMAVMQAMHEGNMQASLDELGVAGGVFRISGYRLLQLMGISNSGQNQDMLDIRLSKLRSGGIEIHKDSQSYEGGLIDDVYRDKISREFVIRINTKLARLFAPDAGWTRLEFAVRSKFGRDQLSKWLHAYLSSHNGPYPISIERIHSLSGSSVSEMFRFRQLVKKSISKINQAVGWKIELDLKTDCLVGHPICIPPKKRIHSA